MFESLPNDFMRLNRWERDPRVIMLAGGKERAELYARILDRKGVEKPYISLDNTQNTVDRCRLVFAASDLCSYGLGGNGSFDFVGRFAGLYNALSVPKKD